MPNGGTMSHKTITARRDELAREITKEAYGEDATVGSYELASNPLQVAIDRIIELEGGK